MLLPIHYSWNGIERLVAWRELSWNRRWPLLADLPAGLELQGRQGCSLGALVAWHSGRAEIAGTPARQGAGGPLGGIVAVERDRWVAHSWAGYARRPGAPGAAGMWIGGACARAMASREKKNEKYPLEVLRRRAELGFFLFLHLPFYKRTLRRDLSHDQDL